MSHTYSEQAKKDAVASGLDTHDWEMMEAEGGCISEAVEMAIMDAIEWLEDNTY